MRNWTWILLAGVAASPATASDRDDRERALKEFFEGQSVTVRIDMPATESGIDVRVGRAAPIDLDKLGDRMGQAGVSIREGTRVPITKVHIKDDLIEFQLAGGGFDWVWDTQSKVSPETGKSHRERDLEKQIKDEKDSHRRHELEDELDDARRHREREERGSREAADVENSLRDEQDHRRALLKGSRFNLRWDDDVPPQTETPQAVMELLSPWIDFSGFPGAPQPPRPERRASEDTDAEHEVREGMSWAEVQDRLGAPDHLNTSREGDLRRSEAIYDDHGLELTFVNDILVRIREVEPEPR